MKKWRICRNAIQYIRELLGLIDLLEKLIKSFHGWVSLDNKVKAKKIVCQI